MDTLDAVLNDMYTHSDGVPTAYDVNALMEAFNLPGWMYGQVSETLDELAYARNIVRALESDPRYAIDTYIAVDGEYSPADVATVDLLIDAYTVDMQDSVEVLRTYADVVANS